MTMEDKLWFYRAKLLRIIDGDTIVCTIDAGFGFTYDFGGKGVRIRILGINAPELKTKEGQDAKVFLSLLLAARETLYVRTQKPDDFGRLLADVYTPDDKSIADLMTASGHAVPYKP
jgi:micrococcal nuclease